MKNSMFQSKSAAKFGSITEARRTKTLPFPVPIGRAHKDAVPSDDAPFLVELEREVTWRFIAPMRQMPAENDCDYTVELVNADDRKN